MMQFLLRFFTWWNGTTFGTQFTIWRDGVRVGEDQFGNVYYRSRYAKDPALGHERRWVVYKGLAEPTMIPPGWWGWMHHKSDVAPSEAAYTPHAFELPHRPNLTGTPNAYRPPGSIAGEGRRPQATGDYQPWTPRA